MVLEKIKHALTHGTLLDAELILNEYARSVADESWDLCMKRFTDIDLTLPSKEQYLNIKYPLK